MRSKMLPRFLRLSLFLFLVSPGSSYADTWPHRTVRVIVPNPAGVNLDIVARLFAAELSTRWNQPVIVENLPGADALVAAREFVSRHDDHTLLYSFPALISINPLIHQKLPYDPQRDFKPIATTSDNFLAIAVPANSEAATLSDLARIAQERPKQLNWAATPGLPYYAFSSFLQSTRSEMTQAHYRDFNQAIVDLGENRIDVVIAGVIPLLSPARARKIKLLAFVNSTRASVMPEVPTAAEHGFPDLTFSAVTGFFGGPSISDGVRDQIAADLRAVAAEPAIRNRLASLGSNVLVGTSGDFSDAIAKQSAQISRIVQSLKSGPFGGR